MSSTIVVIPEIDLDEKLFTMVERAFRNPVLRTDNEVDHLPVTVEYAAADLKTSRNTVLRMIERRELEINEDKKVTFKSLHALKKKRALK